MPSEAFRTILRNFGKTIGLTELSADDDDYCCLSIDDHLILHLKYDPRNNDIVLFAELGHVDEEKKAGLYRLLLELNSSIEEAQGCTLAKLQDETIIALCYKEPFENIEQQRFEAIMKVFLETCETCLKKITEFSQGLLSVQSQSDKNKEPSRAESINDIPFGMRV